MKNQHSNLLERAYVSMKIRKCDKNLDGDDCKPDEVIETLLKAITFTIYFATDIAELGN